jgi:hypothetical protein
VGYSKYTEDIVDRWVDDNREREAAFYRLWNREHVPPPPPAPGDIYLQSAGKLLEDEEVFPAPSTLRFSAVVNRDGAPPVLTLLRKRQRLALHQNAAGLYTITGTKPESVEIDAASGAYHRAYAIHFVEIAQIELIPGLLDEIKRLTSNPPGWTRGDFDDFRARLGDLFQKNSVPENFAHGLVEYFLAVQSETNQDPAFKHRLEAAYVIMRKFAPVSDIAALITEYFRYRVNLFGPADESAPHAKVPLNAIREFFIGRIGAPHDNIAGSRAIELVIAEAEYCCIEAVRAMLRNDSEAALGLTSIARKIQGELRDPLREERLRIVEARAHLALGETGKARAAYQPLLNSTCDVFCHEATNFLLK